MRVFPVSLVTVTLGLITGCSSTGLRSPLETFERFHVYQPARYPAGNWQPTDLVYEDAWFAAADGTQLHGWFVPCLNARATVLFAHGNAGNITNLVPAVGEFCKRHCVSVLIFDYRGFGRSDGVPSEEGLLQDARAGRAWLAQRAGIHGRDIVLMGRSLGGGVVVDLAARDGARGLILESTFTSVPDVAGHHAPFLPLHLLMASRFNSLGKIKDYHGPLMMSHGDADQVIPYAQGVRLFEAANEPKTFVAIRRDNHNDPQSEEYHKALDDFIASLPPIPSGERSQ